MCRHSYVVIGYLDMEHLAKEEPEVVMAVQDCTALRELVLDTFPGCVLDIAAMDAEGTTSHFQCVRNEDHQL